MTSTHRVAFRALAMAFLVATLLAPLPAAAWPGLAPYGESFEDFVRTAYLGAGFGPSCEEVRDETAILQYLAGAYGTSSGPFKEEARHFVSLRFETQSSYTHATDWQQNPAYSLPIPHPSGNHQATQSFVITLYHAFLQRDPDLGGLNFWTAQADNYTTLAQGKAQSRAVLEAFSATPGDQEFTDLLESLVTGSTICCEVSCPWGSSFDFGLCECVSNCTGPGRWCDQY